MFDSGDSVEFDALDEGFHSSYILIHLKIQESDVIPGLAFLITMIIVSWVAIFITLIFKSKKIRL